MSVSVDGTGRQHATVPEQEGVSGRCRQLLEMVGRHDDGKLRVDFRDAREGREQQLPTGKVETGARLVEQQQARLRDERPGDQGALALACRAVAEAALGQATEAEHAEQRVGAVDVEHREPLLEVADRARRARPDHLADRQERREAVAVARVDEPDPLAQARDVGAAHRLAEDLDRAAARELDCAGERQQRGLAGAVSARAPPSARRRAPSTRRRRAGPCWRRSRVPAPHLHVLEPECGLGLTRRPRSPYTY